MTTGNVFSSKRLRKDTLLYIPVFLAPALVNILLLMIFTRFFSPEIYGQYTIVMSTAIIMSALLSQWITLSIQRFRPIYIKDGKAAEFNEHLLALMMYITIGFLIISFLVYLFLPQELLNYQKYYWPSVCLIISSNYFSVLSGLFQIDLLAREYRNINVMMSVVKLFITLLWLYIIQLNSVAFIWAACLAQVMVMIPMVKRLHLGMLLPQREFHKERMSFFHTFLCYGFPLVGWYIGTTVLNLTDRYMLDYFHTSREVGIYSANFTIAVQALALICNPLYFAAQPLLMNESEVTNDKRSIEAGISSFTRLFILIAFPFGAYFSIYRNEVSTIILGEQFAQGSVIIPILVIGFFAWNLGLYGQLCCQIDNRTKQMFYFVVIAAIANFMFNLISIPRWGYIGASISTTLGFLIYTALLYFSTFKKQTRWILPWRTLLKAFFLTLVLVFASVTTKVLFLDTLLPIWNMMIGLIYFPIYLFLLILMGETPFNHRKILKY